MQKGGHQTACDGTVLPSVKGSLNPVLATMRHAPVKVGCVVGRSEASTTSMLVKAS